MQLYPFKAELPKLEALATLPQFFPTVKSKYLKYKSQDLFEQINKPSVFLYQIVTATGQAYTGIIASTAVQHYIDKVIKGHEATITQKEQKQLKLLQKRKAQVKPILLTYAAVPVIDAWIEQQTLVKPQLEIELDGNTHRLWQVNNTVEVQILADFFQQHVPTTYIADGHHRAASATNLYRKKPKYNRLMAAFFSFKELDILDFNRVVEHPRMPELLPHLRTCFEVKKLHEARKPKRKFELSLYYEKQWYRLKWKPSILKEDAPTLLDTDLLNRYILRDLLEIEDIRTAPNIAYVGGAEGAAGVAKAVDSRPGSAGFCLHPVSFGDLSILVDAGEVLPPKSTWFEPRMLNGLTIFNLE